MAYGDQKIEDARTKPSSEEAGSTLGFSRPASAKVAAVWGEIQRLGLESHIAELDTVGYTVIPPEKVAPPSFTKRMIDAFRKVARKRLDVDLDLDKTDMLSLEKIPWQPLNYMLFEDRVFQEAACNPVALAFADYAVGRSCMLSTCIGLVKGPGSSELGLHTDHWAMLIPSPYPAYPLYINTHWLLTDYTKEGGALCVVPGSHLYGRAPEAGEGLDERVAVEAPAGSLVVWGGNTWHGSFARKIPGLRLSLVSSYTRPFVIPQEPYKQNVTPEIIAANPPRFHELMGKNLYQGFKEEGPDEEKLALGIGTTRWD